MKKFVIAAFASTAALALTACGDSTDASDEAMADTVEMPADAAVDGTPDPVVDDAATLDAEMEGNEMDAAEAADAATGAVEAEGMDASVEDAIDAAEDEMQ